MAHSLWHTFWCLPSIESHSQALLDDLQKHQSRNRRKIVTPPPNALLRPQGFKATGTITIPARAFPGGKTPDHPRRMTPTTRSTRQKLSPSLPQARPPAILNRPNRPSQLIAPNRPCTRGVPRMLTGGSCLFSMCSCRASGVLPLYIV